MATAVTRGIRRILSNRKYEDYESLKKYISAYYTNGFNEIVFDGYQVMTNAAANLEPGDLTIALIGAEAVVYLSTLADDEAQDLKSVWVTYQSDDGIIHGPIEHVLNDDADTTVEACLGNEDQNDVIDTGEGGKVILLTALAGTLNQYAGDYMVTQSGAGVGDVNLIVSNTAATPTTLTVTDNTNAGADDDIIQIQEFPCDDFYRLRQMYSEVEVLTDKTIRLGDHNSGNYYGLISQGGRYNSSARYFSTDAATSRCFLGRIKASASHESTDAKKQGNEIQVTLTPKAQSSDAAASDIMMSIVYQDNLDWQPCIELEPATDVNIQILSLDNTNVDDAHFEVTYLEALM